MSGRLSRLQAAGNVMTGAEQPLINDWCQQFPSHSIGDLRFGPDGALYVSAGDGASFGTPDYGQFGGSAGSPTPLNPCGDPPGGVGGSHDATHGRGRCPSKPECPAPVDASPSFSTAPSSGSIRRPATRSPTTR